MSTPLAIGRQTIRANWSRGLFLLLLGLVLLITVAIPLTAQGDGTAVGEVKMILTYSLGLLGFLLSTLWSGCTALSREIEGYQMHLVQNSAATRGRIWVGKWLGVLLPQLLLLAVGLGVLGGTLEWKMARRWLYTPEQKAQVAQEVLCGRREFRPESIDFAALAVREYDARAAAGKLEPGHNPQTVKEELLRQLRARATELPPRQLRPWVFTGISGVTPETPLQLRCRLYLGDRLRSSQRQTQGDWLFKLPNQEQVRYLPMQSMSGSFQEISVPGELVSAEGRLEVAYANLDPGNSAVSIQEKDGPFLYAPGTGFWPNLGRAGLLMAMQLAFLAALGVTLSGVFSSPVAMFVAIAYLVIGLSVKFVLQSSYRDDFGNVQYGGVADRVSHTVAATTDRLVVSVGDFDATDDLIHGRLIGNRALGRVALELLLLRSAPLALLGIWLFKRRELGLVIRTS